MIRKIFKILVLNIANSLLRGTRFFSLKATLFKLIGIDVGKNTKIVGPVRIGSCCDLSIGDDCWVGANLTIHGNGSVSIGNNCDIAPDVTFLTGTHEVGGTFRRAGKGISTKIFVGNGCWIGARVTCLGDVRINDSSIVGACSFVIKDVEYNSLYAGNPAKKIKNLSTG